MRRSRKPKEFQSNPQQKQALKYLSLISERETGYLQDWAIINEIKQQDIQSSNELGATRNQGNQRQGEENPERTGIVGKLVERRVIGSRERVAGEGSEKKIMEVRVQNFANIPHRKTLIKLRKSELDLYRQSQSEVQFHSLAQHETANINQQQSLIKKQLGHSASLNYIDKIRKLSLPWVKQLPRQAKNQGDLEQEAKAREDSRRLNQIIKNKIRRKHSNKYILQRQQDKEKEKEKDKDQNQGKTGKSINEEAEEGIENNQIKILRNWLDYNRSKRKRSITSLLNQHFEFKYLEKKKQREKAMALKSLKAISTLSTMPQH